MLKYHGPARSVEDMDAAVRKWFKKTIARIRARNSKVAPQVIESEIEEALSAVRAARTGLKRR